MIDMSRQKRKYDVWTIITIGIVVLYAFFLVMPLVNLLRQSITYGGNGFSLYYFKKFFSKKYYYGTIFNSLKVTLLVTVLTVIIATPLAYLMTTKKIKGKGAIALIILISSMQAPFIGAYSWILLLGRSGIITQFMSKVFGITMPSIYGFGGIILVLTLKMTPLVYMYVSGALKKVDNSLLEAAESMGCSGIKRLIKIIIPLIMPTIMAGSLLVFMRALADFGTPMLIGEGYQTVPVLIFNEFISEMGGDEGFAAAISVMVILFATSVFLLQKYASNREAYSMSALNPIPVTKFKGIKNFFAHLYVYIIALLLIGPQLYVVYTSFLNTNGRVFVDGYSLDSYRAVLRKVGDSIGNTFYLSSIAIIAVVCLAVVIAYVTVRRSNVLTNALDVITMFPYIVPGSILGIALLISFNKAPFYFSGTAFIMILAFVIRRLPYTIRSSSAIMYQIHPSIEEASISLGTPKLQTFFKITLPMMTPGVVSGAILSWISIISELSTTIILYTAHTRTMTIAIYTEVIRGNYGTAAALSTILSVVTMISLMIFFKVSGRKEITL